jgi:hypothetical protein
VKFVQTFHLGFVQCILEKLLSHLTDSDWDVPVDEMLDFEDVHLNLVCVSPALSNLLLTLSEL